MSQFCFNNQDDSQILKVNSDLVPLGYVKEETKCCSPTAEHRPLVIAPITTNLDRDTSTARTFKLPHGTIVIGSEGVKAINSFVEKLASSRRCRIANKKPSEFRCEKCRSVYSSRELLLAHACSSSLICGICGLQLRKAYLLARHTRSHAGVRPYACDTCGKTFTEKHCVVRHQRIHTGEKPYECSHCGKTFRFNSGLTVHLQMHDGAKPHTCQLCNKGFVLKHLLNEHHLTVHLGVRKYQCLQCNAAFQNAYHLQRHTSRCHTTKRSFKCKLCPMTFKIQESLRRHEKRHDARCGQPLSRRNYAHFACKLCGQVFYKQLELDKHTEVEHGRNKQGCECELGGKSSNYMRSLRCHTRHHSDMSLPRCVCSVCKESFNDESSLRVHRRQKHSKLKLEKSSSNATFQCQLCVKVCATRNELLQHIALEDAHRYLCVHCFQPFSNPRSLHCHRCKAWSCEQCDFHWKSHVYIEGLNVDRS